MTLHPPRIALFGTSADPPTLGHQKILEWLSQTYDTVWIWASDNPFKQHPVDLDHRTAMLRQCVAEICGESGLNPLRAKAATQPRTSTHTSVIAEGGGCRNLEVDPSLSHPRSLITLERARRRSPQAAFTLVIGSDLAAQVPNWYRAEALLASVTLLIVPRPGFSLERKTLSWLRQKTSVAIAPIQGPAVSSTQYRRGDREVVSPVVQAYIERENLYPTPSATPSTP